MGKSAASSLPLPRARRSESPILGSLEPVAASDAALDEMVELLAELVLEDLAQRPPLADPRGGTTVTARDARPGADLGSAR
jgi:hypothetical protein